MAVIQSVYLKFASERKMCETHHPSTPCQESHDVPKERHNLRKENDVDTSVIPTEDKDQIASEGTLSLWPQIIAAFFIAMTQLNTGAQFSYAAVAVPQLSDEDSDDLILNRFQISTFASILNIGYMASALFAGVLVTWFGQRKTLMASIPIGAVGWILQGVSPSFGVIVAARIIQGISSGLISPVTYNYIVEMSHPSIRGRLVAMCDFFRQFGMIIMVIIGSLDLTWRQIAYTQLAFLLPPFFALGALHDSPRWLALKGRYEEAQKSLSFYRGKRYNTAREFSEIKYQTDDSSKAMSVSSQLRLIFTKNIFPIFLITSFLMLTHQSTGNIVIISYSIVIFNSAEVNINSYTSSIIIASVRLLGIATFIAVGDRLSRRLLFSVSLVFTGSSCCALGIFFYLRDNFDVSCIQWLPLLVLTIFSYFISIAVPVFFVMRSELLPNSVRSLATGFQFTLISTGSFIFTFTYPYMVDFMGLYWTFISYGACSFVIMSFTLAFVPETRGKSLEQIADMNEKKRSIENKQSTTK